MKALTNMKSSNELNITEKTDAINSRNQHRTT